MRYVKEKDSAFLFLITHNGALKVRSRITFFVWDIGILNLEFIWNLNFGAWNFSSCKGGSRTAPTSSRVTRFLVGCP
jgi:hypothetical protein